MSNGHVYFITYLSENIRKSLPCVKIGSSQDIKGRLNGLQTSSPFKLMLITTIQSNNEIKLEKKIHKYLNKFRLTGEWFKINPESIKIISDFGVSEDNFLGLFDFGYPDLKDLEIQKLNKIIHNQRTVIKQLNQKLIDRPFITKKEKPRCERIQAWKKWADGHYSEGIDEDYGRLDRHDRK
jgi:hypothetical protein